MDEFVKGSFHLLLLSWGPEQSMGGKQSKEPVHCFLWDWYM